MLYERPCRASSSPDPENRAAQRLGKAMIAADITTPTAYKRLQQDALRYATERGGLNPSGSLTADGMNLIARYLEDAIA